MTASHGGPDDNDAQAGHLVPVRAWPLALRGREDGDEPEMGAEGVYNALRAGDGGSSRQSLVALETDEGIPQTAHTLTAEGFDASEDGTGRGTPLIPWSLAVNADFRSSEDIAQTVTGSNGQPGLVAVPLDLRNATRSDGGTGVGTPGTGIGYDGDPAPSVTESPSGVVTYRKSTRAASPEHDETWVPDDIANTLNTFDQGDSRAVDLAVEVDGPGQLSVRRLTPLECERLQGFPDGWTQYDDQGREIADGPRYRFMGNAVAIPPTQWVIDGIAAVMARTRQTEAP